MTHTPQAVVQHVMARLTNVTYQDQWAQSAVIWSRLWLLGEPIWRAHDDAREQVLKALAAALALPMKPLTSSEVKSALAALEAFDVPDDESQEWQYAVDLVSLLAAAFADPQPLAAAEASVSTYLDAVVNAVANDAARGRGRSVSHSEVLELLPVSREWARAVQFVSSLA